MVVNNGAAAVLLAVAALAGRAGGRRRLARAAGRDRRRLPDPRGDRPVAAPADRGRHHQPHSGSTTTRRALEPDAGAILRVHPSNFRALGFVAEVAIEELCELGVPVIDDVGSGVLAGRSRCSRSATSRRCGARSRAGAALVCCSGDKLLGGPQAGLLVGRHEAVAAARAPPAGPRAADRQAVAGRAGGDAARCYRDPELARREIPVLAMLDGRARPSWPPRRAGSRRRSAPGPRSSRAGRVGGGALPLLELDGPAVALRRATPDALAARAARRHARRWSARIHDGRLLLDPRTLDRRGDRAGGRGASARGAGAMSARRR